MKSKVCIIVFMLLIVTGCVQTQPDLIPLQPFEANTGQEVSDLSQSTSEDSTLSNKAEELSTETVPPQEKESNSYSSIQEENSSTVTDALDVQEPKTIIGKKYFDMIGKSYLDIAGMYGNSRIYVNMQYGLFSTFRPFGETDNSYITAFFKSPAGALEPLYEISGELHEPDPGYSDYYYNFESGSFTQNDFIVQGITVGGTIIQDFFQADTPNITFAYISSVLGAPSNIYFDDYFNRYSTDPFTYNGYQIEYLFDKTDDDYALFSMTISENGSNTQ